MSNTFVELSNFVSYDTMYTIDLYGEAASMEALAAPVESTSAAVDLLTASDFAGEFTPELFLDEEGVFVLNEMGGAEVAAEAAAGTALAEGLGVAAVAGAALAAVAGAAAVIYFTVDAINTIRTDQERYDSLYSSEGYRQRAINYFLAHERSGPEDAMTARLFNDGARFNSDSWSVSARDNALRNIAPDPLPRYPVRPPRTTPLPMNPNPFDAPPVYEDQVRPNMGYDLMDEYGFSAFDGVPMPSSGPSGPGPSQNQQAPSPQGPPSGPAGPSPPQEPPTDRLYPGRRPLPEPEYSNMVNELTNGHADFSEVKHHSHVDLPTDFRANLARLLLKFASGVYGDYKGFRSMIAQQYKVTEIVHADVGATCLIASNRLHIVLAFRGTQTITDILADAVFFPWQGTHAGFALWTSSLREDIFKVLRELQAEKQRRILVTGHSLGGCMAQIFSLNYKQSSGKAPDACYAFSSPACFLAEKAMYFDQAIPNGWRVYAQQDPVPFLLNFVYTHTSKIAEIEVNGRVLWKSAFLIRLDVSYHSIEILWEWMKLVRSTDRLGNLKNRLGFIDWDQFLDVRYISESVALDPKTPPVYLGQSKTQQDFINDAKLFMQKLRTT